MKLTATELRAGNRFNFSLFIFDDVSSELDSGDLNLMALLTEGRHSGIDVWTVFHAPPKFTASNATSLRLNVRGVVAFGQEILANLWSVKEWVSKSDAKQAEPFMKTFVSNKSHIGLFLEVGKGGSITEYIHPFQADKLEDPKFVGFPVGNPKTRGYLASISAPTSMPTPSAPPAPKEEKYSEAPVHVVPEFEKEEEGSSDGEDL